MAPRKVEPRSTESEFRIEELFFSTTDEKGIIRSGNDVFVRVSGHSLEDLIGSPHNIIRHPDIPRSVFRLLWSYIQGGKSIAAYVKNMAKDGSFYWVMTMVMPIEEGYLSIRLKPSSALFPRIAPVYSELKVIEDSFGKDREAGIQAATQRLLEILRSLGFQNYDSFMHYALLEEVKSRDEVLRKSAQGALRPAATGALSPFRLRSSEEDITLILNWCEILQSSLNDIFDNLGSYLELNSTLHSKGATILSLAQAVRLLSLNAAIKAERLEETGRTLSVVADNMGANSTEISQALGELERYIDATSAVLADTTFHIATAKLELEMTIFFARRIADEGEGARPLSDGDISVLLKALSGGLSRTVNTLVALSQELSSLNSHIDHLQKTIRTMGFIHITGKVEAAQLDNPEAFLAIFEEVIGRVNEARSRLDEMAHAISGAETDMEAIEVIKGSLEAAS